MSEDLRSAAAVVDIQGDFKPNFFSLSFLRRSFVRLLRAECHAKWGQEAATLKKIKIYAILSEKQGQPVAEKYIYKKKPQYFIPC